MDTLTYKKSKKYYNIQRITISIVLCVFVVTIPIIPIVLWVQHRIYKDSKIVITDKTVTVYQGLIGNQTIREVQIAKINDIMVVTFGDIGHINIFTGNNLVVKFDLIDKSR
jgi:hypothetical protein